MSEKMRINKYLSSCGVCSRRKAEKLILLGEVSVNGKRIKDLATLIDIQNDEVRLKGKVIKLEDTKVYYMLNKPSGVISASSSKYGKKTVVDLIEDNSYRLFPVGRLDKDTTGLIILTNDGELTNILTHPSFEMEKSYEALIKGHITSPELDRLKKGVMLDGKKTARAKLRLIKKKGNNSLVEITLIEGRKRQVKRMFERVGHSVLTLKRTMEGGLTLGDLKEGESRLLSKNEIKKLYDKRR